MFVTKYLVVPSRKPTLDDSAELGIDRLYIFIRPMSGAGLPIDDLSVLLEKLYLDLSGVIVDQLAEIAPAIDDGASYLLYTVRTKRICYPSGIPTPAWSADSSSEEVLEPRQAEKAAPQGWPCVYALKDLPADVSRFCEHTIAIAHPNPFPPAFSEYPPGHYSLNNSKNGGFSNSFKISSPITYLLLRRRHRCLHSDV